MKLLVIGSKARVEKYLPDLPITREVETVVVERGASDDEILDAASDADFIMADAISPVSARLIESMPNLKLIHSEGVAYNAIDLDAARPECPRLQQRRCERRRRRGADRPAHARLPARCG